MIGSNKGGLPWKSGDLPGEIARYVGLTSATHGGLSVCIVGKKTWDGLPTAAKIGTRDRAYVIWGRGSTPDETMARALELDPADIWIIGGAATYHEFLPRVDVVFETVTAHDYVAESPVYLRNTPWRWWPMVRSSAHSSEKYTKHIYVRPKISPVDPPLRFVFEGEGGYTRLVEQVLRYGVLTPNRTGVDTKVCIDTAIHWDLRGMAVPLLQTKSVAWKRNVMNELCWFLSGSTDEKALAATGCEIWRANAAEASARLGYPEGVLGPVYGHQWRNSGAPYIVDDVMAARDGAPLEFTGVDQIQNLVEGILRSPSSRRLIVSSWDADQGAMALPPCHHVFQVNVLGDDLHLSVRMRSADLGLGVPYNLASYGFLAHALGILTGHAVAKLTLTMCNSHVYVNHEGALWEQVSRPQRGLTRPSVTFPDSVTLDAIKKMRADVLGGTLPAADALIRILSQMDVVGYEPMSNLHMPMAV